MCMKNIMSTTEQRESETYRAYKDVNNWLTPEEALMSFTDP